MKVFRWIITLLLALVGMLAGRNAAAQDRAALATKVKDFSAELQAQAGPEGARIQQTRSGHIGFITMPRGKSVALKAKPADLKPETIARAFLSQNHELLYDGDGAVDFTLKKTRTTGARHNVKLDQTYGGLPVFGAQAIVQIENGAVTAVHSRVMTAHPLLGAKMFSLKPELSPEDAIEAALQGALKPPADAYGLPPTLEIYDPSLLNQGGAPALVWLVDLRTNSGRPFHETVLVNALSGAVLLRINEIKDAKTRQIYDSNNTSADPGTLKRSEGGAAANITDVDLAYTYYGDTYDFYFSNHGRDGINGAGLTMSATVRYCTGLTGDACPYDNAYWDDVALRMYFGEGFAAADDVVGHELTHGVTQYESNLVYSYQSGAINESFSDMWGEWMDLSNSGGTDTPATRWLMGEDLPSIGAIRNMANPPQFGDPDRMNSPNYYTGTGDSGGVHYNSGVGNKLCYLLTDGGTFNGHTVTGLGIARAADLFYEAQVNLLTPSSDYLALYNAITQAAITLGFSAGERDSVEQASQAVEINTAQSFPVPGNDECAAARTLADAISYTSTTAGATGTATSSCGGGNDTIDVWFKYTATVTGTAAIDTAGSTMDTVVAVYSSCGGTALGCNDDASTSNPGPSLLSFSITSGVTYIIRVSGYDGDAGAYVVKVTGTASGGGGGGSVNVLGGGICINELLIDPNSSTWNFDTDGNGTANTPDDFIELYNTSAAPINITGWSLWSNSTKRYTFPATTSIPAGGFAVVVGGVQSGGALPIVASGSFIGTAGLSGTNGILINGGDNVVLLNPTANQYIHVIYRGDTIDTPTTYSTFPAGATRVGSVESWGTDTAGSSLGRFADGSTTISVYGTVSSGLVLATPGKSTATVPVELSTFESE